MLSMCVGFFMILVDMTIVAVAQPKIQEALHADLNAIVWVTSAYLLTYAVPLLVAGRLGDKYGPKLIFQIGLVVFTAASVWCAFSTTIGMLIAARAVQGIGAALITPQTMAIVTRIFPPHKRGAAMGVWGIVAGVATMVGPLLGGVLTDNFGWKWIFLINLPVGIIGLVLAQIFVPNVETHDHKFDWVGVILSGIGLAALVFGIQDGEKNDWAGWIWGMIAVGVLYLILFVLWEATYRREPLVPLSLFSDRNYWVSNVGIFAQGFAITGIMIPVMFFLQLVGGMSPTRSALMLVPMALVSGGLAPVIGRLADRVHPRLIISTAMFLNGVALVIMAIINRPATPVWQLLIPTILMGVAGAGIWAPLGATATRNLPWHQAGAGAGVYNTTRVVGSVLGSAGVGALMQALLRHEFPHFNMSSAMGHASAAGARLPEVAKEPFSVAMGHSIFLGAGVVFAAAAVALLLVPLKPVEAPAAPAAETA
ncbi:MFS transporter [Gordonia sp. X0973]|uniref:MFS transporter n=1 Tax=Gordonia sp. X0973 TaxID=2742602 RepID=UPI0026575C4B|nr:MFS transporter [Gordonia sp. X0973]